MKNNTDLTGIKFGKLLVIKLVKNGRKVGWHCQCDCGNERILNASLLLRGVNKSCGCSKGNVKHGMSKNRIFKIFKGMVDRCYNNKNKYYYNYGGRGIKICDEWVENPSKFIEWSEINGYDSKLQIDRINNDGDYSPTNCRWTTKFINNHNERLLRKTNKSGYKGVSYRDKLRGFNTQLMYENRWLFRKSGFKTAKEAAIYRDIFIIKNNLPHPLNFPELKYWATL